MFENEIEKFGLQGVKDSFDEVNKELKVCHIPYLFDLLEAAMEQSERNARDRRRTRLHVLQRPLPSATAVATAT